jgi:hypothetical protein
MSEVNDNKTGSGESEMNESNEQNIILNKESKTDSVTTTIIDHIQDRPEHSNQCVVYKFRSRPPYEGFILILVIVLLTALLIWWLNSKFIS